MTVTAKSKGSSKTQAEEPTSDEFSFVVPGRPQPKGRPRMSRKGRVYTPKETVLAEKSYIAAVGENPPVFDGPVSVEMTFCKESTYITVRSLKEWQTPLRGDLDNYVKLCLDGCQRAGIIPNDRFVMRLEAVKE
jgi:Holliday junction resolvase RusA-like endonuclease